jgi:OmpA-OmpF porin, OOP family
MTKGRVSFLAALALAATFTAGCADAPPPPPPPPPQPQPPPTMVVAPPANLDLVGAQLNIKTDIEFDVGKYTIRDTGISRNTLAAVLAILQAAPQITRLRVEGHTDNDGNSADNMILSLNRAKAVVQWLVDHGVASGRLSTAGCAAKDPIVPNDTPEHKQRNRRTEFDIEGLQGRPPPGYTDACAPNTFRR